MSRHLTLHDISDLRAYERERDELRRRIIELKRRRRVAVGPVISVVFENRDTIRFQIQEMARAERMLRDEAIQGELDAYNPLIPEAGQLSATMFLELTSEEDLRRWLPQLVGVERALQLHLGPASERAAGAPAGAPAGVVVGAVPEAAHEASLTRETVTSAVHYVRFELDPDQVERFAAGPASLVVDHPRYHESAVLSDEVRRELLRDLRP